MADKKRIIVICGATATGKTSVSIKLAKELGGEIICADSMQIYKGLEIGTALPSKEEQSEIKHHLFAFLPPENTYSVAQYVKDANCCVNDILSRGKLPIIVGGTGLYIESLVKGLRFTNIKTDENIRFKIQERLEKEGIEKLYEELMQIDERYAKNLHINQHKRITRALEIHKQTGINMSQHLENSIPKQRPYDDFVVNLAYDDRAQLYENIEKRVDIMLESGILNEAELVYKNKEKFKTAAQAIGYKEFFAYFEEKDSLENCALLLKQSTRRYAKRQITWFKRMGSNLQLQASENAHLDIVKAFALY